MRIFSSTWRMLIHKKFSFGIVPMSYKLHSPPDKNIHTANKSQNRKGQDQLDLFFFSSDCIGNNNNRKVVVGGYFIRPLLPGFYVRMNVKLTIMNFTLYGLLIWKYDMHFCSSYTIFSFGVIKAELPRFHGIYPRHLNKYLLTN